MTLRIETSPVDGGLEITRIVTNDSEIVIPEKIEGVSVVSLGGMFLRESYGVESRNLVIPASVKNAAEDAISATSGLRSITYGGDFDTFSSFGWISDSDCIVTCGDGFRFGFLAGYPLSFPGFDETILSLNQRMTPEKVMERLALPVPITEHHRETYVSYLKSRIIPMAEHAISENDSSRLNEILKTGILNDEDVKHLLEGSVRSGKVVMTSVLMSFINQSFRRTV